MKTKNLLLTSLFLLTAASLSSCNTTQNEADVLVVGMECAYAPFNWTETSQTDTNVAISNIPGAYAEGYDVQVARIIADELDLELQIKSLSWDALINELNAGSIDAIIAGMSPTPERLESINFTSSYYESTHVMLVNKNSTYADASSLDDFAGATVIGQTGTIYADLVEQLTLISQAKENIESLSTEVISLKSVLENNQNRGKFGEFALERILFSIFGDAKDGVYEFQYKLKNYDENERPDAVIFLPEPNKLLCIDSKFPFADYRGIIEATSDEERETCQKGFGMAVKKHITDIANKYIIKNTTAEYALMFVPSDAVFGYINSQLINVVEYARSKNVILTSPSTLQPILATINLVKIQYERKKNIDNILKSINALSKKFTQFTNGWDQLSKTVAKLDEHRMAVDKNVRNLSEQFDKIESVKVIEMNNNEE